MDQHPYGGPGNVFLDTCSPCEANWLDAGELQRIVTAPDRQVSIPPAPPINIDMKDEEEAELNPLDLIVSMVRKLR